MSTQPNKGDLRVWWIPQIPGKPFRVPVASVVEARFVMDTLARYDLFQFKHRIKPDYANAGGLECFSQDDDGEWCEWYDPETGDDIDDVMRAERAEEEQP
jgi:hypothetical protein